MSKTIAGIGTDLEGKELKSMLISTLLANDLRIDAFIEQNREITAYLLKEY